MSCIVLDTMEKRRDEEVIINVELPEPQNQITVVQRKFMGQIGIARGG